MSFMLLATEDGRPVLQPGEKFVISQFGVRFQVESGGGYPGAGIFFNGEGNVYITDRRLVVALTPPTPICKGLDFTLSQISSEKLFSPLFGDKYIQGKLNMNADGNATWSLTFPFGGAEEVFAALQRAAELPRASPELFNKLIAESTAEYLEKEGQPTPTRDSDFAYYDPTNSETVFLPLNLKKL